MKTKNSILGIIIVGLAGTLSSCTASLNAHYGRPVYHQYSRPPHVINDPDLPPVPYLTPHQISRIKNIRQDERRRVDYLEQRRRQIRSELDRPNRYDNVRDRKYLEKELRKLGNQINNEHRRADDRVYSVLTREQRRYWTR
jgi:hypothetical protein